MDDLNSQLKKINTDLFVKQTIISLKEEIKLFLLDPGNIDKKFSYNDSQPVISDTPFWAICWPSGYALADFILRNPEKVQGRKVLDFGSGSGIVAIACSLAGVEEATACDQDPDALKAAMLNAGLNGVNLKTCVKPGNGIQYDLVTAADVLYNSGNLHMLDMFFKYAPLVLLADSRAGEFNHPLYCKIAETDTCSFPEDASETKEHVNIYLGKI